MLFRIARNLAFDHLRRRRVLTLFVRYETVPELGVVDDRTDRIAVWSAVERLPVMEREAIVLRYRWDLSTAEIAEIQNRSEGAVRALLSRALGKLRADLGGEE
ncbi:MAG: RNA polymerase sigma factor [Thermoleophilaceae bacterium]